MSPEDQDDLMPSHGDNQNTSNHTDDNGNITLNDYNSNQGPVTNACPDNHQRRHSAVRDPFQRQRQSPRELPKDGIEDKQDNAVIKYSGAMFSLQNCTLNCDVCQSGESYWASFTERSFHRGRHFKLYRGIMNGKGPQDREKCVVKVFLQRPGTQDLCRSEVRKNERFRQFTQSFNRQYSKHENRVRCPRTFCAPVDEISKLKQIFFTGERKLKIGEHVLFQPDILRSIDDKPRKPRKLTRFIDARGKRVSGQHCPVLDALVHFTYHLTNGELVTCGFEGVQDEGGFSLITPVIHSKGRTFGDGDLGYQGIVTVFQNHTCNQLCSGFMVPHAPEPFGDAPGLTGDAMAEGEENLGDSSSMISDLVPGSAASNACQPVPTGSASLVTPSKASECTESMTGYLEPSAPEMDEYSRDELVAPPPVYTEERAAQVVHWLVQESSNNFLRQFISSHDPTSPFMPYTSASAHSQSDQARLIAQGGNFASRTSPDLNINVNPFSSWNANRRGIRPDMSARSDDVTESISDGCSSQFHFNRSASNATFGRSESAMDTSSIDSSSSPLSRTRSGGGSTSSGRSVDNATYRDHHRLFNQFSEENRNIRSTSFFEERPPSYEESEIEATRVFLIENSTLPASPSLPTTSGARHFSNGDGLQSPNWTGDASSMPLLGALRHVRMQD